MPKMPTVDSDHPAPAQSIIWAFHSYILWYQMILLVDSEGPDKTDLGLHCLHMPEDTWHSPFGSKKHFEFKQKQ